MTAKKTAWTGVWPVVPTTFDGRGALDLESQHRVYDCMIDQKVDGICILANYSEQFVLSDEERDLVLRDAMAHIAGRIPVIVTCSHYSTQIVEQRCRRAGELGAAMIMLMPPYHGALLKADERGIFEHFARASEAGGVPIMVQDAPLSGVTLSAELLARMAREIPLLEYFKIETPQAAAKLRTLIDLGGEAIVGPFDGEEGITLMADLDAGATGNMCSALLPDLIAEVIAAHAAGDRAGAMKKYERILPLINFENRQCGLRAAKTVLHEAGVMASDHVRHPQTPLHPATRKTLLEMARALDLFAFRWGR